MDKDRLFGLLDQFMIETPTWAYADGRTRFGKFHQPSSASTIEEKLADAATVHRYTGCCPAVALSVVWDFSIGVDASATATLARKSGLRIGSVSPNLYEDQIFRHGSAASPDERAREHAHRHIVASIAIAHAVGSKGLSLWLPDGTNLPGEDDMAGRKERIHGALRQWHDAMPAGMKMLLEYKALEPACYAADVADWGMAYIYCKDAGPNARVAVDVGHQYHGQNVEQIISFLADEEMLGGVYLGGRPSAGAESPLGSIYPFGMFCIFHEIRQAAEVRGRDLSRLVYRIEESQGPRPRVQAMISSAMAAQELYAKACLVDIKKVTDAQARMDLVEAEACLRDAFSTDTRPMVAEWRKKKSLEPDPLAAYRASGLEAAAAKEREGARAAAGLPATVEWKT